MKDFKSFALLFTTAAVSGTLAYLGAVASTNSRTAAIEAKVAELEAKLAEKSMVRIQPVNGSKRTMGWRAYPQLETTPTLPLDVIQSDDAPRRPLPPARAFLINYVSGNPSQNE